MILERLAEPDETPMANGLVGQVVEVFRYAPHDTGEALPTVLARSPYGKGGIHAALFGRPSAERGYQVVVQSCRGTERLGGSHRMIGGESCA